MVYKNKTLSVILGSMMFAFSVNVFIMPWHIYNGGMTGLAQILNDLFIRSIGYSYKFELLGLISFLINVPFFIFAWTRMSKKMVLLSLLSMFTQTISLTFIPIPKSPIIDELFFSIILAAVVGGMGIGMVLNGKGTSGGLDILGIYLSEKRGMTVGNIYIILNCLIYTYCLINYDLKITVYSFVYSFIYARVVDYFHEYNSVFSVMLFTKNKTIREIVSANINREINSWVLEQSDKSVHSNVMMLIVSFDELKLLEQLVKDVNDESYLVINKEVKVSGFFDYRLY